MEYFPAITLLGKMMNYLYRSLRADEIENNFILIPKSNDSFLAEAKFPITFEVTFGATEAYAVEDHQFDSKYPTRGVSTSLSKKIALEKYGSKGGAVAVICRSTCAKLGIKEYIVKDWVPLGDILHPEDEEVILVSDKDGPLPKELIREIVKI